MKKNQVERKERGTETEVKKRMISYFVASFRYSQGNDTLQALFHQWAVHNGYLTQTDLRTFATIPLAELSEKVMFPANHVDVLMYEQLSKQQKTLAGTRISQKYDESKIVMRMLQYIIEKDMYYLQKQRPTTKKKPKKLSSITDTIHDPYASYIRKYLLNPTRIQNPIFRALFLKFLGIVTQIMTDTQLAKHSQEMRFKQNLQKIAEKWERHHKGEAFF